jgi:hypothetical protein
MLLSTSIEVLRKQEVKIMQIVHSKNVILYDLKKFNPGFGLGLE